jgi:regulator of protease activity HflC (stomatin/prohibitin superfamily)
MQVVSVVVLVVVVVFAFMAMRSFVSIGATEVGLVNKKFSFKSLHNDDPIAFNGEAGYQAELLMPGLRFKLWPLYRVEKHPWVQVPPGEVGVVIAQVGQPLERGAKSARYAREFGDFTDLPVFLQGGGQKGAQRPVLAPGTLAPIHPVAFLTLTPSTVYGVPISDDLAQADPLTPQHFGLLPEQLRVVVIAPQGNSDVVGIVTTLEGDPLPPGDIASRLGGFADIAQLEATEGTSDSELVELLLGSKNTAHNNYQDFQAFLDAGGHMGLQHDPLQYGAFLLNPFLVRVDIAPMLVVNQGEVAVIKGYVGLPTLDTSGVEFKFGSIVRPGHRGIWQEPLRTGKFAINPRIYNAEIVPTSILTLNWADQVSQAHNLDAHLSPIDAKSREGFVFRIDLQVQIHVPDTRASKVISMVGTMQNLVNEVLQSAVGNHFRNTLQALEGVKFIETRQAVQDDAQHAITEYLDAYQVETRGVYIQDVIFPPELVQVLTSREIANQEKATFNEQQRAQEVRVSLEKTRGTADMQAQLAQSQVTIDIKKNAAEARKADADGEATYVRTTGEAEATKVQAIGLAEARAVEALELARATGYEKQVEAIGEAATAAIAVAGAVSSGHVKITPDVLVSGPGGSSLDGLAATLMQHLSGPTAPGSDALGSSPEGQPARLVPLWSALESPGAVADATAPSVPDDLEPPPFPAAVTVTRPDEDQPAV